MEIERDPERRNDTDNRDAPDADNVDRGYRYGNVCDAFLPSDRPGEGEGRRHRSRPDIMLINHSNGFYDGKQFARPVIGRRCTVLSKTSRDDVDSRLPPLFNVIFPASNVYRCLPDYSVNK